LALICTIANAQNIKGSHQVRVNDEVKKQHVEYAAVDSTGQNMVWDLSEVVLPKWTLTADYTEQIRVIDEVACHSKSPDLCKKPQQTKSIAILLPHILYFAPLPALSR
jgi:hypothetical protein